MRRVYTAPELRNDLTTPIRVERWRHRRRNCGWIGRLGMIVTCAMKRGNT